MPASHREQQTAKARHSLKRDNLWTIQTNWTKQENSIIAMPQYQTSAWLSRVHSARCCRASDVLAVDMFDTDCSNRWHKVVRPGGQCRQSEQGQYVHHGLLRLIDRQAVTSPLSVCEDQVDNLGEACITVAPPLQMLRVQTWLQVT